MGVRIGILSLLAALFCQPLRGDLRDVLQIRPSCVTLLSVATNQNFLIANTVPDLRQSLQLFRDLINVLPVAVSYMEGLTSVTRSGRVTSVDESGGFITIDEYRISLSRVFSLRIPNHLRSELAVTLVPILQEAPSPPSNQRWVPSQGIDSLTEIVSWALFAGRRLSIRYSDLMAQEERTITGTVSLLARYRDQTGQPERFEFEIEHRRFHSLMLQSVTLSD